MGEEFNDYGIGHGTIARRSAGSSVIEQDFRVATVEPTLDTNEIDDQKNNNSSLIYMQFEKPILSSEQKILQIIKKFGPNDAISEEEENNTISSHTSPDVSTKHKKFLNQVPTQLSDEKYGFDSATQRFVSHCAGGNNSSTKKEIDQSSIDTSFLKVITTKQRSRERGDRDSKTDGAKKTLTFDAELQKKHVASLVQEKPLAASKPPRDPRD